MQSAMMRRRLPVAVGTCLFVAAVLMLLLPGTASARLFTIMDPSNPNPAGSSLAFNDGAGTFGTIDPVLSIAGTVGGFAGAAVNFGNDFFIFDLTLGAGSNSIDQISVALNKVSGAPIGEPTTTGYFSNAGGEPDFGDEDPTSITNDPLVQIFPYPIGTGTSIFDFDLGGASAQNINAGETTVRLFVVFSTPTSLLEYDTVSFMLSPVGASDFTVQGEIIPEPATMMLLGTGLVALGIGERRRRRGRG